MIRKINKNATRRPRRYYGRKYRAPSFFFFLENFII